MWPNDLNGVGCVAEFITEPDKLKQYFDKASKLLGKNETQIFSLFGMSFAEILQMSYRNNMKKEQSKMTREEAISLAKKFGNKYPWYEDSIRLLEALGLLKFDEEKTNIIFQMGSKSAGFPNGFMKQIVDKYGTIRLEEWPEGLILWVGGEIRWKSWHEYSDITNPVR